MNIIWRILLQGTSLVFSTLFWTRLTTKLVRTEVFSQITEQFWKPVFSKSDPKQPEGFLCFDSAHRLPRMLTPFQSCSGRWSPPLRRQQSFFSSVMTSGIYGSQTRNPISMITADSKSDLGLHWKFSSFNCNSDLSQSCTKTPSGILLHFLSKEVLTAVKTQFSREYLS